MPTITERFYELHPTSAELSSNSEELFPGGVTHDGRRLDPFRVYMDRGLGCRKWDVDGNEYIDYRTGHGSMILGQANPAVVKAVQEQMEKGTHLSASTELEMRWGSLVKQLVPCAEKLRFQSSGTEAIMMGMRMARAFTGKQKIMKFDGAFHGWSDGAFVGAPGDNPQNGIPDVVRDTMVVLPYDLSEVERTLDSDNDIAAVIFQGDVVIRPSFIEGLRELTHQKGVLLFFDEVVSGFRWAKGGMQDRYGVTPDMSAVAKILAGGLPGGAIAGRAEIIDMIALGKIAHPGTFNANPLSAAAGVAALQIVADEPINERADAQAQRLRDGLNDMFTKIEAPGCAYGVSSIVHVRLGVDHECDREFCEIVGAGRMGLDSDSVSLVQQALINEGLWSGPSMMILSAAHTDDDVDRTVEAYEASLMQAREEGAI